MIAGTLVLEDTTIHFTTDQESIVHVSVAQLDPNGEMTYESYSRTLADFTKALAIAVHVDGMPDYREDYNAAEQAMGDIRWIP